MRAWLTSFGHAWRGVRQAVATQRNLRVQLGCGIAVLALGLWLEVSATEWALLIVCTGLVLGLECLNSALEALCDTLHPERHEDIRRCKDMAAGAVLIAAIAAAAVGLILLGPKLWEKGF